MRVFRDVFSGDELFSDSFPVFEAEGGLVYEVTAKRVTLESNDYGIGDNDEDGGRLDSEAKTVINIETNFDKKGFMGNIKGFMKKVKTHLEKENPDRVAGFMADAPAFVKKILSQFDEYQFFMGESMDPTTHVALMFYAEDGLTPKFWFFKDAVKEEKC